MLIIGLVARQEMTTPLADDPRQSVCRQQAATDRPASPWRRPELFWIEANSPVVNNDAPLGAVALFEDIFVVVRWKGPTA
jgi:hypothetical protein